MRTPDHRAMHAPSNLLWIGAFNPAYRYCSNCGDGLKWSKDSLGPFYDRLTGDRIEDSWWVYTCPNWSVSVLNRHDRWVEDH